MRELTGWIGVDLDGTLAEYSTWAGTEQIGRPVPRMVQRVRAWLAGGRDVRIFTARVGPQGDSKAAPRAQAAIRAWCLEHIGRVLPITATKDFTMEEFWDDRCVQVWSNTGERADGLETAAVEGQEPIEAAELLARLIAGPLPPTAQAYRRALGMAAVLGRRLEHHEPFLAEICESPRKTRFGFLALPELLKRKRAPAAKGPHGSLRIQ